MTEKIILNIDGLPFTDIKNADQIAAILSRETGATHTVTRHSDGYGLLCRPTSASPVSSPASNLSRDFEEIRFRPAWRSQLMRLVFILSGTVAYFFTENLLMLVGVDSLYQMLTGFEWRFDWEIVVHQVTNWAAGFTIVYFGLLVLYAIYSQDYFVGPKGVEANIGLISKDQMRIEFKHMRGVNLKQGVTERLLGLVGLGYGTIEIATSGSDGAEISFRGIAEPTRVLGVLRERLKASV